MILEEERTASNSSLDVTKNAPLSAKDSRKNEEFLEEVSGGRRVILTSEEDEEEEGFSCLAPESVPLDLFFFPCLVYDVVYVSSNGVLLFSCHCLNRPC